MICGIPHCYHERGEDLPICQDHHDAGYLADYHTYRALIEEGHTRHAAAVMAGLKDGDH